MSKLSRMTDKDKVEVLMKLAERGKGTVKVFDLLTMLGTMVRVNRAVFMARRNGTMLEATRDGKKVVSYTVLKGSMTVPKVATVASDTEWTPMPRAGSALLASKDDPDVPDFLKR